MRDDERALLEPWRDAAAALFGDAPSVTRLESGALPGEPLYQLSYPMLATSNVIGQSGHFSQTAALRDHVRALGFKWDESGCIRSAPTPATFNALLPEIAGEAVGFRLEIVAEDTTTVSLGPWLDRYAQGVISVHVCTRAFYASAGTHLAGMLKWQVTTLVHDLTVHALNYHLIPRASALALGDRIRRALPDRAARWADRGASAPLTLAYFYDNDLNRYSYAVWSACSTPSDFASLFDAHLGQLLRALDVRIEETRAGVGDVPSGNTRDMAKLTPTEFSVPRPGEQRR